MNLLLILITIIALFIILFILIQKSNSESEGFGSSDSSSFTKKRGLEKKIFNVTIVFIVLFVVLNFTYLFVK